MSNSLQPHGVQISYKILFKKGGLHWLIIFLPSLNFRTLIQLSNLSSQSGFNIFWLCHVPCGILGSRSNSSPLHWKYRVLTTGPTGKFPPSDFRTLFTNANLYLNPIVILFPKQINPAHTEANSPLLFPEFILLPSRKCHFCPWDSISISISGYQYCYQSLELLNLKSIFSHDFSNFFFSRGSVTCHSAVRYPLPQPDPQRASPRLQPAAPGAGLVLLSHPSPRVSAKMQG